MSQNDANLIVALDVGSAHTRALAVEINEGAVRYRAHASLESHGMRKGLIAELGPAARVIKAVSDKVEAQAKVNYGECLIGVGGPHITGLNTTAGLSFGQRMREISKDDVTGVVERARAVSLGPDREILHLLTRQFVLDDQQGIYDPVGMVGAKLEVDLHLSTCSGSAMQSIVTCANRAGIEVKEAVFEAIAAAESTLTADERELGVCILDIGAHSTEVAVFFEGAVAHTDSIPLGGHSLTYALARELQIDLRMAEELKLRYGHAEVTALPQMDEIEIPAPYNMVMKHRKVAEILEPRAWELFEKVRQSLRDGGVLEALGFGCVMTGGGAVLPGLQYVADSVLHVPTRVAGPVQFSKMPAELSHPAYATLVGMVLYAHRRKMNNPAAASGPRRWWRALRAASL